MTSHGPAPGPSGPTHELQPSCKMAPHRGPGRGCDEEDHHGSSGHCGSPAAGHGAEGRDTRPARVPHDAGRWRRRSRGPPPGDRPKENRRDDVGHRAEPGDARGREGDRRGLPQAAQGHRDPGRGHGLGRHGPKAPGGDGGQEPAHRVAHPELRGDVLPRQGPDRAGGRRGEGDRRGQDLSIGAPVAQVSGRQVLGDHACVGRRDLRRPRRLLAGHRGESAELADVGRLAP